MDIDKKMSLGGVAASAVTEQADAGAAAPATLAANVAGGGGRRGNSGRLSSLLSAALPLFMLELSLLLSLLDACPDLRAPVGALGGRCLEVCWADVACLQVFLADVLVSQGGSSSWPCSCGKLSV